MIVEDCDFWMVWNRKGYPPRINHETREAAETEAQRLATKYPGKKFIVLRGCRKFHVEEPTPGMP